MQRTIKREINMRKLYFAFLLICVFTIPVFSQNYHAKNFFVGGGAGAGITHTLNANYDAEIHKKIGFNAAAALKYFFSKTTGIMGELGYHMLGAKDKSKTTDYYSDFALHYIYFTIAPVIRFKGIHLFVGIYFGFPVGVSYESNTDKEINASDLTLPDIGLSLGGGYEFSLSKKLSLYIGIEVKNQLNTFTKYTASGGKIFAFFGNVRLFYKM